MTPLLLLAVAQTDRIAPDVSTSKIAGTPVAGKLGGKAFTPTRVEWQPLGYSKVSSGSKVIDKSHQYILSFMIGNDFIPDKEIKLWIVFDDGKPLAPRTWNWKPTQFGTDEHRKQSYPISKNGGSVARGITGVHTTLKDGIFSDRFSVHLQFVKADAKSLTGRIALMLPDGSYLNGQFKAKILPAIGSSPIFL